MITLIFTNPFYLWLLVSIPLLIITHFFVLGYLKRRAVKFANFEAIKRVTGTKFELKNVRTISKNMFLLIIRVFVLLFLIFSIAGPVLWYSGQSSEFDFVIAIDASSSMLADDFMPYRLDAARKASSLFVESLKAKTRVGVVSFAGTSFVELDLTDNMKKTEEAINGIRIKRVGGTDIGGAITTSSNLLLREENARVIILLTDGQSTVGTPVDEAIEYANKNHVTVNTIGIGTKEGGTFIKGDLLSKLDEPTLIYIAQKTGGKYYKAENEGELSKAFDNISSSAEEKIPINLSMGFMMIALALLFIEWGMINTKYRTLP
jgi:Ca-activated chloride channel family protein